MKKSSRRGPLARNTLSSLIFQLTAVACGFIIPRLVLQAYGSAVNGLVSSVSQFLGVISFLELGVGAVVQSALYRPLADQDMAAVSRIVTSADRFFRRLFRILLVWILFLLLFYPTLTDTEFSWLYTAGLILAMSISSCAQYYFGLVDRILLTADQRGHVVYTAQTVTQILNTAAVVLLIRLGGTIHMVKLATSLIFLLRPVYLRLYVRRHYNLDRHAVYTEEPVQQKRDGIMQHVAAAVLTGTDQIVLTLFSTLSAVSVYAVYQLVTSSLRQLFLAASAGIQPRLGGMWARGETERLQETFRCTEWVFHTAAVFVYGCTLVLLVPFVQVYTAGVTDADYTAPVSAVLLALAGAVYAFGLPYHFLIKAAGHYRQTRWLYLQAAGINLLLSILLVCLWGPAGAAAGTLAAVAFQTVRMALYVSRVLLCRPFRCILRQLLLDTVALALIMPGALFLSLKALTWGSWLLLAVQTGMFVLAVLLLLNCLFCRTELRTVLSLLRHR